MLAIPEIWHSRIYRFVASLVGKLQDSLLTKFKAGMINHISQGMWVPTENPPTQVPPSPLLRTKELELPQAAPLLKAFYFTPASHSLSDAASVSQKGNSESEIR